MFAMWTRKQQCCNFTSKIVYLLTLCNTLTRGQQQEQSQVQQNGENRQLAEIKYDVASNGPIDGYFFLPGADKPLEKAAIKSQLDSILGEDPWEDKFFYENIGPLPYIPREIDIPNPLTCLCSDIEPQQDTKGPDFFPKDCLEVEELGLCGNETLIDLMPVQVPEGFCERTCGRCNCCFSLNKVAKRQKLNIFLQIADITGFSSDFSREGFLATVLAPTDDAFQALFQTLGISLDEIQDYVLFLKDVLSYHIIPVHPYFDALWTTPFFVEDMEAETSLKGQSVLSKAQVKPLRFSNDGPTIIAEQSSATVVTPDLEGCKSYLSIIDSVLLPYDLSAILGEITETCVVKQGKVYRGDSLASASPASSVGECCDRCSQDDQCNIWQYCAASEGCLSPTGEFVQQGQCELKFQATFEASSNTEPDVQLQGPNVGFISGYTQSTIVQPTIASIIPASASIPIPTPESTTPTPDIAASFFQNVDQVIFVGDSENGEQSAPDSLVSAFSFPTEVSEPTTPPEETQENGPTSIFTNLG